jgi:hypothetical protein
VEEEAVDIALGPRKFSDLLAVGGIPEPDDTVVATACEQLAIRG